MSHVTGILETALYVDDLPRAVDFYQRLFDFAIMRRDDRFCAFGVAPSQVLLLFRRGGTLQAIETGYGAIPAHDGHGPQHMAFAIEAEQLRFWEERLANERVAVESVVHWPRGSVNLYFRDPDGNLIELATPRLWDNY